MVLITDDSSIRDLTHEACQVLVSVEKDQAYVEDRNRGALSARLNDAAFTKSRMLINDRLSIGNEYHFQFDGVSLHRVKDQQGARVEAIGLNKVYGSARSNHAAAISDLSLIIEPNEFVGILGPSGCGKSTLLNMLAGVVEPSAGNVRIDGLDVQQHADLHRAIIGMVPQDDIVHGELTVWQAVSTSARLRLSKRIPAEEKDDLAESVVTRLKLWDRRHHRIRELSGGQRKRVSIAVELLRKNSVLFLDEPSSGLDQAKEEDLMILLRQFANQGRTIVCTTHVLDRSFLFDRILMIAKGIGIYYGRAEDAPGFFGKETIQEVYRLIDSPSFIPIPFGDAERTVASGNTTLLVDLPEPDADAAQQTPYTASFLDRGVVVTLFPAILTFPGFVVFLKKLIRAGEPNIILDASRVPGKIRDLLELAEPVFKSARMSRTSFTLVSEDPDVRVWLRTKRLADRIFLFPTLAAAGSVLHESPKVDIRPAGSPLLWVALGVSLIMIMLFLSLLWALFLRGGQG